AGLRTVVPRVRFPAGSRGYHSRSRGGRFARGVHAEPRSLFSRGAAESAEALPGRAAFLRESEPSSPGSMFRSTVVSSAGSHAHPAGEPAGRGRLHPANADPPGANHHIKGSRITQRSLRSAREPEATLCALRTSAFSAPPCEPKLRVSV